jgi:NADPH2:quinone reductase
MKAIVVTEFGGPEVLRVRDVDVPAPRPGEVRINVRTAGLNFIDIYERRGELSKRLPYTPGREAAGVVESVGEGVTTVKPGDRVAYLGAPCAYAEQITVSAENLLSIPDDLTFEQGAAFPLQGMTAHYLLHEYKNPSPGVTVLVHAAAGGMGLLLVQWAKHLGATVIGTTSTDEKACAAKEAGADHVILYTKQDFVEETQRLTNGHGADLIIDGVGKTTFAGNLDAAAIRGHVVIYGAASGPADPILPNSLSRKSLSISGGMLNNYLLTPEERSRRSTDVLNAIREGWLKLRIDRVFPLEQAPDAHRLLEGRKSIGKVLLSAGIY